jgi:RNA polymerase sigma-70 factor (ECF subfamily)
MALGRGIVEEMSVSPSVSPSVRTGGSLAEAPRSADDQARLKAMAEQCFQFIWRSLRRLGVPEPAVDDAAQRVFEVATRKLASIRPEAERAFLFNTAVRVASSMRRHTVTRRETSDDVLEHHADPGLRPDDATERKRQREQLDTLLDSLPMELRTVFVLFELEGLSSVEIALLLEIPTGTAASRLRRAREQFQAEVKRLRAKQSSPGAPR